MTTLPFRSALIAAGAIVLGLSACSSNQKTAVPHPPLLVPAPPPEPAPSTPMSGAEMVSAVQAALNNHGAKLTVDGHIGARTHAALRVFQRENHLRITGQPDPETLKALGLAS